VPESRQDWPKLVQVAEKWTIAEPKNSEAWYELGLGLEGMGYENSAKLALAEKAYKQTLSLDSAHVEALMRLGALAKNRGDTPEVQRIQTALMDIDKDLVAEYSERLGCEKLC
jgi:tetratricopeptide (TPR) repeat protein